MTSRSYFRVRRPFFRPRDVCRVGTFPAGVYHPVVFRLTRQVRFFLNDPSGDDVALARDGKPVNGHGGFPPPRSVAARFFQLDVTLEGAVDGRTGYLLNIKDVDARVRADAPELIAGHLAAVTDVRTGHAAGGLASLLFGKLEKKWLPATLRALTVHLSPYVSLTQLAEEFPVASRLSAKFEFSASHRLHNPGLSDEENRKCYGKCNNPHGHGHNYELQVTLAGNASPDGLLGRLPTMEQVVAKVVLDKFDHKNLNVELPEFEDLNPSVENIAMVIYRLLKPHFGTGDARLASVTVWETPKTWCEYSE